MTDAEQQRIAAVAKGLGQFALAGVGLAALTFTAFNAGFDMGNDVGICVVMHLASDVPVAENPACQRAEFITSDAGQVMRETWIWMMDGSQENPHD